MNLQDVIDKVDDFTEDERVEYLTKVFDILCPISMKTMSEFQVTWNGSRGFEEFVKEQNKQIKMCIKLECSEVGKIVREKLKLPVITLETEL
jgi:hypothetical protein